jgi:Na+/proline symporter
VSGYGGTPPGWQDPYGPQSYGGSPYPGAPQPSGYAYGPPGVPVRQPSSGSTTACLVCNIASVLLCCGILGIPGAIVSAIAMGRVHTDPESARKLTIAGWILFGLSMVCGIIIAVIYLLVVISSDSGYDSTSGI